LKDPVTKLGDQLGKPEPEEIPAFFITDKPPHDF
jgi:hypothetical protein